MPRRNVALSGDLSRRIAHLHPDIKRKVRAAIEAIRDDPATGDRLVRELDGFRKVVIGEWRTVYRDEGRELRIHAIGRRATVYSELVDRLRSVHVRGARYRAGARERRRSDVRHQRRSSGGTRGEPAAASTTRTRAARRR